MDRHQDCDEKDSTESKLNQALRDVIQDLPDVATQMQCRRRARFGAGLILAAPFCLVAAFLPWPGKQPIDQIVWIGFSCALLIIGGWQRDKASRDERKSARMLKPKQPDGVSSPGQTLRRIK